MSAPVSASVSALSAAPESGFVLGGNVFGWTADEDESFAVLDAYHEAGGRAIDTADAYSSWIPGHEGGESEEIIGRWLSKRGHRDEVQVATKVGQLTSAPGLSRASIRKGLDDSLRRLQTDHVDLYYAHFDDPDTPLEDTVAALDEVVREGKVKHLAASNYSVERLTRALEIQQREGLHGFEVFQAHYNLARRKKFEADYRDLLLEHGIQTFTYYSLAQGFLTGKYREVGDAESVRAAPAQRYLDERGLRVLAALDRLSEKYGVPQAAIALAWLAAQPVVGAPVASARTVEQLPSLLAMRDVTLGEDDLADLEEASA